MRLASSSTLAHSVQNGVRRLPIRRVLVIDDDYMARLALKEVLDVTGFEVHEAEGGEEGLAIFAKVHFDAVLLDLKMPRMNGMMVMSNLKQIQPDTPILILTGHGDVPTAVAAIKEGAYDFMLKPVETERLVVTLSRAIEKTDLEKEVRSLNSAVETSLESVLGKSQPMRHLIRQITQVTQSDFSIVIDGETGTGKSFIAKLIHSLSKRAEQPFVVVDMGIIPENLAESELFGFEKGAFTGADRSRKGFFELANHGTILIDELDNMSGYVQAKLLSVVEQRQIRPIGGNRQIPVDVRIIGATNTNLQQAVKERRFREDLFFRLNEFALTVLPLRDRVEDIPFLAQGFLSDAGSELNRHTRELSDEALQLLLSYPWPGNVRELKNVVRRALLLSEDGIIRRRHIELTKVYESDQETGRSVRSLKELIRPLKEVVSAVANEAERRAIRKALDFTAGNKSKAAVLLKIDYKTLLTKIREYKIEPHERAPAVSNLPDTVSYFR